MARLWTEVKIKPENTKNVCSKINYYFSKQKIDRCYIKNKE